nr:electron transport complex subunit RsxA [bacterium]
MSIGAILLSTILVNNFVLVKFLGICPFLGVSKKLDTAMGMGLAVTFVMGLASVVTWLIQHYVLDLLHVQYLQTLAFILVIAALVQFVEMVIKKTSPGLYTSLGVYLPLITTNCAVLGVAILNIQSGYNLLQTLFSGLGGGLGFMLGIVLFAGIREQLETAPIPQWLKGFPLALITAGLMSIAFLGFQGLIR